MRIQSHELAYFFELLGQATYYMQHVENSLHHLLAMNEFEGPGSVTKAEANEVLGKYRRKTLGGLLTEIQKAACFALPIERLRALNGERKWMIHQILEQEEYRLTTDAAYRDCLFQRLEAFIDEAQDLNQFVGNEMVRATLAKGIGLDAIGKAIEREMRKLEQ